MCVHHKRICQTSGRSTAHTTSDAATPTMDPTFNLQQHVLVRIKYVLSTRTWHWPVTLKHTFQPAIPCPPFCNSARGSWGSSSSSLASLQTELEDAEEELDKEQAPEDGGLGGEETGASGVWNRKDRRKGNKTKEATARKIETYLHWSSVPGGFWKPQGSSRPDGNGHPLDPVTCRAGPT